MYISWAFWPLVDKVVFARRLWGVLQLTILYSIFFLIHNTINIKNSSHPHSLGSSPSHKPIGPNQITLWLPGLPGYSKFVCVWSRSHLTLWKQQYYIPVAHQNLRLSIHCRRRNFIPFLCYKIYAVCPKGECYMCFVSLVKHFLLA